MADVSSDLDTVATALTEAQSAVSDAQATITAGAPSVADQVLAAITPVLVAAGWSVPAEIPATTPVSDSSTPTDTPAAS